MNTNLREILESCPLLHTSTCNHAERAWIERARAALAAPAASQTPARKYFDYMAARQGDRMDAPVIPLEPFIVSSMIGMLMSHRNRVIAQWAGAILREHIGPDAPTDDVLLARLALERGLQIQFVGLSSAILTERGVKVRDVPLPPEFRWTQ